MAKEIGTNKRPAFVNKDDAFTKALIKAEQGLSYAEICKSLQVKENFFIKEDRAQIELVEKSWLLSKARNNFENKRFNNALWGKYCEVRFSTLYNSGLVGGKKAVQEEQQKEQQGEEWKELEQQLKVE